MKIREIKTKSIITKSNLPDADLVINPYIGCEYACKYCYADFMRRFSGHGSEDWGSFIDVKINAPDTINPKKIKKDSLILVGSVTDPYQPLEKKYQLTKRCLEILLESQPRIEILTKSALILRDISLLQRFKNLRVGISIGILDERLSKQLEPRAALPRKRLNVLKKLHDSGISTYLFISPIFPEISDIKNLIKLSKEYVEEIYFENLNIRQNNKERILEFIDSNRPELRNLYESLLKNNFYWNRLEIDLKQQCKQEGIKCKFYFHHSKK